MSSLFDVNIFDDVQLQAIAVTCVHELTGVTRCGAMLKDQVDDNICNDDHAAVARCTSVRTEPFPLIVATQAALQILYQRSSKSIPFDITSSTVFFAWIVL